MDLPPKTRGGREGALGLCGANLRRSSDRGRGSTRTALFVLCPFRSRSALYDIACWCMVKGSINASVHPIRKHLGPRAALSGVSRSLLNRLDPEKNSVFVCLPFFLRGSAETRSRTERESSGERR